MNEKAEDRSRALEDSVFPYGNIVRVNMLACILIAARKNASLFKEIKAEVNQLLDHVGPLTLEDFLKKTHELWKKATQNHPPHPYWRHSYLEDRQQLRAQLKSEDFVADLVAAALLQPSENHKLTTSQIRVAFENLDSFAAFSDELLYRFDEVGADAVAEALELTKPRRKKLRSQVETLDFTMSELRLLCLVLELTLEYRIEPYDESDPVDRALSSLFPLAG